MLITLMALLITQDALLTSSGVNRLRSRRWNMRIAVLLIGALAASLDSPLPQSALFTPASASPIHVGKGGGTVLFADLDRDGHLDMLSRHLLERVLVVRVGDGRGSFRAAAAPPVRFDYDFGGMAVGDLNSDEVLDVVVTPGTRDAVDVFLGTGQLQFRKAPGSPFTVSDAAEPFNKRTIRLLDLNEDGSLDVVTANGRRRNTFGVLYGDGKGSFGRGSEVPVDTGQDGYVLDFADFNGDRHLDVVSASRKGHEDASPGRVIVRFGDGHGKFSRSSQSAFETAVGPRSVMAADFNGDRHPDIAVANRDGLLSIFTNDGRGAFLPPSALIPLGVDGHSVVAADVNRDGRVDLVCANVDAVAVFLGGKGGFAPAAGSPYPAGPGSYFATVADLNRDGKLDIAASAFEGTGVTLLLQK
jgi:hypothetical protein